MNPMVCGKKRGYFLIKSKDDMMQSVFKYLNRIQELLEQIDTITQNQMTILIGDKENLELENRALSLVEEMVECKDKIITELTTAEEAFQNVYDINKEALVGSGEIKHVKEQVEKILVMKEEITKREQQNMLILHNQSKKKIEKQKVLPNSNQVAAAYKKQQIKT